jgi:hypothetical protein
VNVANRQSSLVLINSAVDAGLQLIGCWIADQSSDSWNNAEIIWIIVRNLVVFCFDIGVRIVGPFLVVFHLHYISTLFICIIASLVKRHFEDSFVFMVR